MCLFYFDLQFPLIPLNTSPPNSNPVIDEILERISSLYGSVARIRLPICARADMMLTSRAATELTVGLVGLQPPYGRRTHVAPLSPSYKFLSLMLFKKGLKLS
jgi:hypothetical protein